MNTQALRAWLPAITIRFDTKLNSMRLDKFGLHWFYRYNKVSSFIENENFMWNWHKIKHGNWVHFQQYPRLVSSVGICEMRYFMQKENLGTYRSFIYPVLIWSNDSNPCRNQCICLTYQFSTYSRWTIHIFYCVCVCVCECYHFENHKAIKKNSVHKSRNCRTLSNRKQNPHLLRKICELENMYGKMIEKP